jgi:hypothetical protein
MKILKLFTIIKNDHSWILLCCWVCSPEEDDDVSVETCRDNDEFNLIPITCVLLVIDCTMTVNNVIVYSGGQFDVQICQF